MCRLLLFSFIHRRTSAGRGGRLSFHLFKHENLELLLCEVQSFYGLLSEEQPWSSDAFLLSHREIPKPLFCVIVMSQRAVFRHFKGSSVPFVFLKLQKRLVFFFFNSASTIKKCLHCLSFKEIKSTHLIEGFNRRQMFSANLLTWLLQRRLKARASKCKILLI